MKFSEKTKQSMKWGFWKIEFDFAAVVKRLIMGYPADDVYKIFLCRI